MAIVWFSWNLKKLFFKFDIYVVAKNYRVPLGISDHARAETDVIIWLWRILWTMHFLVMQKKLYISHAECSHFLCTLHWALKVVSASKIRVFKVKLYSALDFSDDARQISWFSQLINSKTQYICPSNGKSSRCSSCATVVHQATVNHCLN